MTAIASALRDLMGLGLSGETLIAAVSIIERAVQEEREAVIADAVHIAASGMKRAKSGAERTAEWRARKAEQCDESDEKRHPASQAVTPESEPDSGTPLPQEFIPPSPPKGGSSPTGAAPAEQRKVRRAKGSRFAPEDFQPSPSHHDQAEAAGLSPGDLDRALARFKRHEFPRAYTDWNRCFANWLDREKPRHDRPDAHRPSKLDHLDDIARAMAASRHGAVEPDRGDRFDPGAEGGGRYLPPAA